MPYAAGGVSSSPLAGTPGPSGVSGSVCGGVSVTVSVSSYVPRTVTSLNPLTVTVTGTV